MEHRSLSTEKREIERLVKKAQAGDEEAFSKLYDIFINPLYRYVYFRCNGTDPDDLLTTIFVKIWSNLSKYKPTASFTSWAFRIAHNVVIDFYRVNSHAMQNTAPLNEDEKDTKRENITSHAAELGFNREILKKALLKLKEKHQQIIILKFLNELSNEEIAEITGKSVSSLRILQFRALRILRRSLQEMGITEP